MNDDEPTRDEWNEKVSVELTRWQARIVEMWLKGELRVVDNDTAAPSMEGADYAAQSEVESRHS